jgi:hypothetical protein
MALEVFLLNFIREVRERRRQILSILEKVLTLSDTVDISGPNAHSECTNSLKATETVTLLSRINAHELNHRHHSIYQSSFPNVTQRGADI